MRSLLLLIAIALCLLATIVAGKGSFGSPRAFGGGYNRVGKSGWYSQNYRYRTRGMYWYYGSRYYHHGNRLPIGYDGPENRLGTGIYNDDQSRDVLCKRNISLDESTVQTPFIRYRSTMTCFKQLFAAPGDPGNVYLEDLMLDRYSWNISLDGYPTFDLIVYPDKDIVDADMNMTLRLRRLVYVPSRWNFTSGGGEVEVDLAGLSWSPCSLEACGVDASNTFGRPSSRFIDNSRITSSAITTIYNNNLRITIRVWLSEDFNEDPFYDHVFLHPAQIKVDVSLEAVNGGDSTQLNRFVALEAVVATTAADKGSIVTPIKIDSALSPVIYDPAAMNRVQFGEFNDIAERKAGQFAWFTSTNKKQLCYNLNTDPACVYFHDWAEIPTTCTAGDVNNPTVCDGLLRPGQVGRSFRFIFQTPFSEDYTARFQTHFGFINPNAEFVPPSAAPSLSLVVAAAVLAVVSIFNLVL